MIKNIFRKLAFFYARDVHNRFKILSNKYKLRNYEIDIKEEIDCDCSFQGGKYAIFVYYEPNGLVSKSAQNIFTELKAQKVNTIVMCNFTPSDEQISYLKSNSYKVLLRGNIGFDFGAYKDGVNWLIKNVPNAKRLLLLNDSVYYFSRGISRFVSKLLGEKDVISSFENWQPQHANHFQSFALSISDHVLYSASFQKFWRKYIPVSNRIYAIENGEKKLSHAILNTARSSETIYNINHVRDYLRSIKDIDKLSITIASPVVLRSRMSAMLSRKSKGLRQSDQLLILENIFIGSPIHTGIYYFIHLECPIVKKDLIYRNLYNFWEIEEMLSGHVDQEELVEFLTMLRKKGNTRALSPFQRLMTSVGAK